MVKIGDVVTYVDTKGKLHDALITAVHGVTKELKEKFPDYYSDWTDEMIENQKPAITCVFVSSDPDRTDGFGRQIERAASVVYQASQPAWGNYWTDK